MYSVNYFLSGNDIPYTLYKSSFVFLPNQYAAEFLVTENALTRSEVGRCGPVQRSINLPHL